MAKESNEPKAPKNGEVPKSQLDGWINSEECSEGHWNLGPADVRGVGDEE